MASISFLPRFAGEEKVGSGWRVLNADPPYGFSLPSRKCTEAVSAFSQLS
jgi:hypothetical protein